MMIGAVEDPMFGRLLVCGSGGVLLELLADVSFRLHPLDESDVADMLAELRGRALLHGWRGAAAVDERALAEALLRLSQLLEVCPEIAEMDVNPIKVLPAGVRAVDVRVRVARERPPQPYRRVRY
jgi:acyl-CoA synthetase (NDP forming)